MQVVPAAVKHGEGRAAETAKQRERVGKTDGRVLPAQRNQRGAVKTQAGKRRLTGKPITLPTKAVDKIMETPYRQVITCRHGVFGRTGCT